MVTDMEPNKKLSTFATEENSILHLFLYHNLIYISQVTIFCHENSQQKRTPTNRVKSFF